jgi:ABC-type hemin transport system substrate-binding protein
MKRLWFLLVAPLLSAISLAWAIPLHVVDARGQEVKVASIDKIVSLGGGMAEILFALG